MAWENRISEEVLTVLLGLNDRVEILKLLEDRDSFFPKCINTLLPSTAWRCAALGWCAHKNDAANPPVGPCRRSSGSSLVCSHCPMCSNLCDSTHTPVAGHVQVHVLRTSGAPQQRRYCRLLLIACRLPAFWEFLFYKFLKKTNPPPNQLSSESGMLSILKCLQVFSSVWECVCVCR